MRTYDSMNLAYYELIKAVEHTGEQYTPRGKRCRELRPGHFVINYARRGLYTGLSRKLNYAFYAAETMCYIAGWGEDRQHGELLCAINKNMKPFLNSQSGTFDGSYGPRLMQSLGPIYDLLQTDIWTRQAYASIWSPGLPKASVDIPCTLGLHFYAEKFPGTDRPVLSMSAYMRSNDLNWGTPYDVGAFCAIQSLMADCLGIRPGRYNHTAGSLHFYEADDSQAEKPPVIAECTEEHFIHDIGIPELITPMPMFSMQRLCDLWCQELHDHVVVKREPKNMFKCSLETAGRNQSFWRAWSNMIRFDWKTYCDP